MRFIFIISILLTLTGDLVLLFTKTQRAWKKFWRKVLMKNTRTMFLMGKRLEAFYYQNIFNKLIFDAIPCIAIIVMYYLAI